MLAIRLNGEVADVSGPKMATRGRTLSDAQGRRINDLLYGLLLASGLSPADAHRVLSLERTDRQ
ncbi:hypothetical protein ACYOEI_42710, partial [Singulisphaera rosea]